MAPSSTDEALVRRSGHWSVPVASSRAFTRPSAIRLTCAANSSSSTVRSSSVGARPRTRRKA